MSTKNKKGKKSDRLIKAELYEKEMRDKLQKIKLEKKLEMDKTAEYDEEEERKIQENFKKEFPDYDPSKVSNSEVICIHNHVNNIFNNYIIGLYKIIHDPKKKWNKNVRAFIKYHDKYEDELDIDTDRFSEKEISEVQQMGFDLFVEDKCADIDEDEFDGPNDLSPEEWENLDDIILYYYNILE